jgi:penicillin-binding protein 1A
MNYMLSKVPEEGTGRRAALEGIKSAGKTGTTNAYRDAWYVGYTGNFVAGVWFGNEDHTSTNNMTGGSLPAMTWHEVMAFAHQNLELRPIPGLSPEGPKVARTAPPSGIVDLSAAPASGALSRRSYEVIGGIGDLLRRVERPVPSLTTLPGSARAAAELPTTTAGTRAVGGRIALP